MLRYEDPVEVISVYRKDGIDAALSALAAHQSRGHYLAGYAAYDMGYALEPKLAHRLAGVSDTPLLQFGVFKSVTRTTAASLPPPRPISPLSLSPDWSQSDYLARFNTVQDYIAAGDVYQVNLTFPMRGIYDGSALDLFQYLRPRQPVHYGGVVSLGEGPEIVSLSPELFFQTDGQGIAMRPMKGTVSRQADAQADIAARDAMFHDPKSRAENLMIVDLLRNDLSRLARRGSVKVPELFALESYPTLHQMTSKVTATLRDDVTLQTLFQSLFPCGSVTGAPKIRAMEIIDDLEGSPRGAYCGAMGYIHPDGAACFNVGIRTLILDGGQLRYNVGSGLVRDSVGVDEYHECLLKADVLRDRPALIETLRKEADGTLPRVERHLDRMDASARALGYPFTRADARAVLDATEADTPQRLRLSLSAYGALSLQNAPLVPLQTPLRVALSQNPLSATVQEFDHKVDARDFYDGERDRVKAICGADEVIFVNADGALCEGSFTSLFIKRGETYFTPSRSCGLLPGVLRADMIAAGQAVETMLGPDDLLDGEIYLGNSLRGLMRATLIQAAPV